MGRYIDNEEVYEDTYFCYNCGCEVYHFDGDGEYCPDCLDELNNEEWS